IYLEEHQRIFCETFEQKWAAATADRLLGGGNSTVDWDARGRGNERDYNNNRDADSDSRRDDDLNSKPKTSLEIFDAGDDPGKIPPREWLLGNQFCRGFISSIVAAGGTGKSALRLLQLISLATGRPLSGQHIFHRSRVLLISLEDDIHELRRRIKA